MKPIDVREAGASIGMGLISVVIDIIMKAIAIGFFFWLYQFRLIDQLGPDTVEGFFDWQWHKSHWWVWILLFFADDFTFYWHHRLSHEIRMLWTAHVNHHSSEDYNLSTALRQSPTEYIYKKIWWIWMPLLGFHPLMILTMMQLNLIYQFWIHTETIGRLGFFEKVFNTPSHHRVHHGSNVAYLDRNYGGILIIWDRLFNTFKEEDEPVKFGITKNIHTYNLLKITFHELKAMVKDIRRSHKIGDKLRYLFLSPGWSHDGEDQRAEVLREKIASKSNR
jgi:sterol desaturase/sphingolipid hydroxylase (fatty acid hydroxylase superfamily)